MTRFLLLLALNCTVIGTHAQFKYHLLLEGNTVKDKDTALYQSLDWYGFYTDTTFNSPLHDDPYVRVTITLKPQITTSNKKQSLFLLGLNRGERPQFSRKHSCGSPVKYEVQQTVLLPGKIVGGSWPTSSCNRISISAIGSVNKLKELSGYQIFVELKTQFEDRNKLQEITSDIIKTSESIKIFDGLELPYVYSIGDFDLDADPDFILYYRADYYLYLTTAGSGDQYVKLMAKSRMGTTMVIKY